MNYLTKRMVTFITSKISFLAWGPIGLITKILTQKFIEKLLELTVLGVKIAKVNVEANRDLKAVTLVLNDIRAHEGEMTDAERKEFDQKLAQAGRDLIRFDSIR